MDIRRLRLVALMASLPALTLGGCDASTEPSQTAAQSGSPSTGDATGSLTTSGEQATATSAQTAWVAGQYLVRTHRASDLDAVAAQAGASVLRAPGLSGYGLVDIGDLDAGTVVAKLYSDDRVSRVYPNGRTEGSALGSGRHRGLQWHLDSIGEPDRHLESFADVTIAVLDTGVNHSTEIHDGNYHKAVSSLLLNFIVPGWDFINQDSQALDDHQHGTHIATTIAADGAVMGTAPGATLMPVKVLDENNAGSEWELVEGLYYAITHGADVVNMSLSFDPTYVPSGALVQALGDAADEGIVLVASSGNHLADQATFPAAHPDVIAVGGSTLSGVQSTAPAWYGNLGTAVDIMAPGGDTAADADGDGYSDGVLAHTIRPNQPHYTQYFFMAGTSQAAAITSGVAAQLLHDGVPPHDIAKRLQLGASASSSPFLGGEGAGELDSAGALAASMPSAGPAEAHIGLLPYLSAAGTDVIPTADLAVLDENGSPLVGVDVLVTALGDANQTWLSCTTDTAGRCQVQSGAVSNDVERAVLFRADAVVIDQAWSLHPRAMVHESPEFQELVAAFQADPALADLPIAVSWDAGTDGDLGDIASGFSVVDTGSGLASLPIGMVFNPRMVDTLPQVTTTVTLQDSSVEVTTLQLGGSGLASLPIGMVFGPIGFIQGSGLASLPIGLHPRRIFVSDSTASPVWLDKPTGTFGATVGSPLYTQLVNGGWNAAGYPAATWASAASGVTVAASASAGSNRAVTEMDDPLEPQD